MGMQKLRVLLVDDEEQLLEVFRRVLVRRGMDVVGEATNGAEAFELSKRVVADVLLTDHKMPMMDGIQLARALVEQGSPPIIIVLSAYGDPSLVEEARAAGVTKWLQKGLKPRDLCEQIYKIAGREPGDHEEPDLIG
jgi:YesN/AraC family two-component response regulator